MHSLRLLGLLSVVLTLACDASSKRAEPAPAQPAAVPPTAPESKPPTPLVGTRFWWDPAKVEASYELDFCPNGRVIERRDDTTTVGTYRVEAERVTVTVGDKHAVYVRQPDGAQLRGERRLLEAQGASDCPR